METNVLEMHRNGLKDSRIAKELKTTVYKVKQIINRAQSLHSEPELVDMELDRSTSEIDLSPVYKLGEKMQDLEAVLDKLDRRTKKIRGVQKGKHPLSSTTEVRPANPPTPQLPNLSDSREVPVIKPLGLIRR